MKFAADIGRRTIHAALYAVPVLAVLAGAAVAGEKPFSELCFTQREHYSISCQGSSSTTEEYITVLEACWPQFRAFFGAEPKLKKDEKLQVNFYENQQGWEAALRAEGTEPPSPAGGYYSPGTKRVYLFRQPTCYYTRCLLIHEACHQFHYLACTGNRSPRAPWYIEGVVEYLAWHWWDGKTLKLGQVPLSLKDYPAAALKSIESGEIDLRKMVKGSLDRPLGSQLVRYLVDGEGGKLRERWRRMAHELDRGGDSEKSFAAFMGDPAAAQPRFLAWLRDAQEPWTPVFNEWERTGADSFTGYAQGVVSACRVKKNVKKIEAVLTPPEGNAWRAGLLIDFKDQKNYTMAFLSPDGSVSVEKMTDGKWSFLKGGKAALEDPSTGIAFSALRTNGSVELKVNGTAIGTYPFPPAPMGLCLRDCRVAFRNVAWETE